MQELQSRGLNIPVLISIRDEDYNITPINGKAIKYDVIELELFEAEAEQIYNTLTIGYPHSSHRTFEEAWQSFGGDGPLIEFVYLLTNNQTLTKRLQNQIDFLLQEGISDEWLELLQLVCYAGRLGCSVDYCKITEVITCTSMQAAVRSLKDEYLIRITNDNKLEALHPIRAQIVNDVLRNQICTTAKDIVFKTLSCVSSKNVRLILMDYFSQYKYRLVEIQQLAQTHFRDWVGYANAIKATDCFIRNCVYPDLLPDSDEERAAFGYALFWMAKRNLAITLLFSSNEIVKSVCTGEIQSCADAIRGLFEHPTLSDSYQSAVEEIVKRLIFEMRIISFSVTDDEVNCKFVPSFLTEETTSENKNENQYVSEIDEMRCNVNELILETIKLIDDIYKKGHFTKDRWKRIEERIKIFRTHIFSENRLPFFAVDPYCLYSEGSSRQPIAEYFPMQQLLSVGKYEKFRKLLNRVYASLDNFFNQFAEVLLVRINKIPFYKVFDTDESHITDSMFPCRIEDELAESIILGKAHKKWIEEMQKIGAIKTYLRCCSQVLKVSVDDECAVGTDAFKNALLKRIEILYKELISCEILVGKLIDKATGQIVEFLEVMKLFFEYFDKINDCIASNSDPNEIIQAIDNVFVVMILLQPYVIEHDSE